MWGEIDRENGVFETSLSERTEWEGYMAVFIITRHPRAPLTVLFSCFQIGNRSTCVVLFCFHGSLMPSFISHSFRFLSACLHSTVLHAYKFSLTLSTVLFLPLPQPAASCQIRRPQFSCRACSMVGASHAAYTSSTETCIETPFRLLSISL